MAENPKPREAEGIFEGRSAPPKKAKTGSNKTSKNKKSKTAEGPACAAQQIEMIESAREEALVRIQTAYQRLIGLGSGSQAAQEHQREAEALVRKLFGETTIDIGHYLSQMRHGAAPSLNYVCAARRDPNCASRDGYVRSDEPDVITAD